MLDKIIPDPVPGGSAQSRVAVRVNLFMAATLHASGAETPVKIRDLSASGAQIESPLIPAVGAPMILSRGRLSVHGTVAWCNERRCGIRFAANVSVREWMANPVNREQQRIDSLVTAVKAGVVPPIVAANPVTTAGDGIAQDLTRISLLLDRLGDALANDPAVIARHGVALQNLDIAMQMLGALAATIEAGVAGGGGETVRLAELRKSCAQALRNAS